MNFADVGDFIGDHWDDALEITLLAVAIYFIWRFFQGTPGANVLAGLVTLFLVVTLASMLLGLPVIGWIATRLSAVLIVAMLIIFQPELRRGLAALGSHRIFFPIRKTVPIEDRLTEITFELSNRQLGALLAVERGRISSLLRKAACRSMPRFRPNSRSAFSFPKLRSTTAA